MTFVQQTLPLTSNRREIKEIGLRWLGHIPVNWHVHAVKRHYDIQLGKMLQNGPQSQEDREVLYAKALHVQWDRVIVDELPTMWASPVDIEKFGIRDGDLLVCEGGEGGRAGVVLNPPPDCIIQNALHRVRAKPTASVKFLQYVLSTVSGSGWFEVLCEKATIAHFTREKFAALMIPVPPLDEQDAIVAFLDRKLVEIDRFIALKRRLIDLLHEQKATLIHHSVTCGLDPNVEMKPSGILWLPDMPVQWVRLPLHRAAQSLQTGPFGSQLHAHDYVSGGIPVINPSNIRDGRIVPDFDCAVDEETANRLAVHRLKAGDIVFARRGEMGRCALVSETEDGWLCGTGGLRMRPKPGLFESAYLVGILSCRGVADFLSLHSVGTVMDNLNTDILHKLDLPVPPLAEQKAIIAYVDEETRLVRNALSRAEREIDLIQEYRTALIAEAVTGKIDVRAR